MSIALVMVLGSVRDGTEQNNLHLHMGLPSVLHHLPASLVKLDGLKKTGRKLSACFSQLRCLISPILCKKKKMLMFPLVSLEVHLFIILFDYSRR